MKSQTKKFMIVVILLAVDLVLPDPLPLVDELILSILTIWYGVKI